MKGVPIVMIDFGYSARDYEKMFFFPVCLLYYFMKSIIC